MGSISESGGQKPHAVCIPYPAQGHITPMLKLAKLLHWKGFHITFVNTEYNHNRLLKSRGRQQSAADAAAHDFRFETIPDGLPPSDADATQDIPSLCESTMTNCLAPFRDLLARLNAAGGGAADGVPPVTCIVSDGAMSFTLDAAEELGVPDVLFWTTSACGFMCYLHYQQLVDRGFSPLKDVGDVSNGYLDTPVDGIPGMPNIRLRDIPSFIRTTDSDDIMVKFVIRETRRVSRASAIVLNTFEDLERAVLDAMAPPTSLLLPPVYSIGPLSLLTRQLPEDNPVASMGSSLWTEDTSCLEWLDGREPGTVVYVNFGSITVMSNEQLVEFAWGLAGSNRDFLWIIRPDLVKGESAVLPGEFSEEVEGRGMLGSWCPQEQVLAHPSVGGFLTHCGWNSTLESICGGGGGVPMVCWPFFAEQQTNCRYACVEWGVGMEIDNDVKREEVKKLIGELMGGEKGKEMKKRALEWRESAVRATKQGGVGGGGGGSSAVNLDRMVSEVLLRSSSSSSSYGVE